MNKKRETKVGELAQRPRLRPEMNIAEPVRNGPFASDGDPKIYVLWP